MVSSLLPAAAGDEPGNALDKPLEGRVHRLDSEPGHERRRHRPEGELSHVLLLTEGREEQHHDHDPQNGAEKDPRAVASESRSS